MQKLSLRLLASLSLLALAPSLHANINNIKGTYNILKSEYKNFSVIHGAVAWETGTIRRMYDFGILGQDIIEKKTEKRINADGIEETIEKSLRTISKIKSKTIQLIYYIFYRVPESTGDADFKLADKIKIIDDSALASFIADCMLSLETLPQTNSFREYQEKLDTFNLVEENKKPSFNKKFIVPLRNKIKEEFKSNRAFASYDATLKSMLPFLIDAALECLEEESFPSYTPQLILLGLLYAKTSGNHASLETYYKKIATYYSDMPEKIECLNTPSDWATWKTDIFKKEDFDLFLSELKKAKNDTTLPDEFYEKQVFVSLSPTNYPPMISYSTACINKTEDDKTKKGNPGCFPDCMDTTLRNTINVLTYNPTTKLFETSVLEDRLGITIPQALKDFYANNPDPLLAGSPKAHNDWAQMVISNIPFASYNRTIQKTSPHTQRGFIKINDSSPELKTFLQEKSYTVVDKNTVVYEIKASMRNVIVALNSILGLNLFDDNLPQEFMKENFIETYLPKIAIKLKAAIPDSFDTKKTDKNDFTAEKIALPLNFVFEQPEPYDVKITIRTREGHGEILLKMDEETQALQLNLTGTEGPISQLLLTSYMIFTPQKDGTNLEPLNFFPSFSRAYLWLFSQPIDNPDTVFDLLNNTSLMDAHSYKLFLFLARKNADIKIKSDMIFDTYRAALRTGFAEENKSILKEIIDAAKEGMQSTDVYIKENASFLFTTLIQEDKAVDEGLEAAKNALNSSDPEDQANALTIFSAIVSKDRALDEAAEAAKIGIKSSKAYTKANALTLFSNLVSKNKALDEALEAAKISFNSKESNIQSNALDIFLNLIDKDKGIEEALKAAKIGINSKDSNIQINALNIFGTLLNKDTDKNTNLDEIVNAAKIGINSTDSNIQISVLNLFSNLISKGKAFNEALNAAKIGIKSSDPYTQYKALEIFSTLVSKERAFDEALDAAQIGLKSSETYIKSKSLEIFSLLISRDKALDEALDAAQIGIKSSDPYTQYKALEIFSTLVSKERAFDEAFAAAQIGLKSSETYTKNKSLEIFSLLISRDKDLDEAFDAAQIGIKSSDPYSQYKALDIFSTLVSKGRAFDEAFDAAQIGLKSSESYVQNTAQWLMNTLKKHAPKKDRKSTSTTKKAIKAITIKDPQWTDKAKKAAKKLKLIKEASAPAVVTP